MPSIRDFSGGVLNQELLGKDSGAGIIIDANNVLSSRGGELRKRTGTKFLMKLFGESVLVPFRIGEEDIVLAITENNIKGFSLTDDGLVPFMVNVGNPPEFPTEGWTGNKNGDWTVGGSFSKTDYYKAVDGTQQTLSKVNDWKDGQYFYIKSEQPHIIDSLKVTFASSGRELVLLSHKYYLGDAELQYSDDGITWFGIKTEISDEKESLWTGGQHLLEEDYSHSYSVVISNKLYATAHKYWRVFFAKQYGVEDPAMHQYVPNVSFSITNIKYLDDETRTLDLETNIQFKDLKNIKYAQLGQELFLSFGNRVPYVIKYEKAKVFPSDFVPEQDKDVWTRNGYPACVAVYAGRLWFAGFDNHPTRVIASEFNKTDNFLVPSDIKKTSPISIDGRQLSTKITSMFGAEKALYVLSNEGVSMIDAPDGTVVSTDMIEMQLRNREPADGMSPTVKDDIMLYLGRDKRKILATDYDFVVQRFKATDLSVGYRNFLSSGVSELHYVSRLASLVYGCLNNGNWFGMLLDFSGNIKNSIYPFVSHNNVYDMSVVYTKDGARLLMVVESSGKYMIVEKNVQKDSAIMDFMSGAEKEKFSSVADGDYLDCCASIVNETPVSTFENLPFSIGEKVAVFADGIYVGEKEIQPEGLVLDTPAKKIIVGYNYDAYAVLKLATPYTSKKYPKEVATYLINTGYLEIGNSFDNLQPILNNMRDKLDLFNKPILLNGEYTKTMDKLDNSPYIILRSNEPMPFMITGIDFKVDYSNYQGGI